MTGDEHRGGARRPDGQPGAAPEGPLWSTDDLADLHAGVLTDGAATELAAIVAADPGARDVLAALDATTRELRSLPPVTMPSDVAARLNVAIHQEFSARFQPAEPALAAWGGQPATPAPPAPGAPSPGAGSQATVTSLDTARRRRNRRLGWGGGVLVAAAAAVGIAVAALPGGEGGQPAQPPQAGGPPAGSTAPSVAPLALTSNNLGSALTRVRGATDYGPLENPNRLGDCLAAVHIDPSRKPIGVHSATFEGRPGVVVLLPAGTPGHPGRFQLVVVGADCGPASPRLLSSTNIG